MRQAKRPRYAGTAALLAVLVLVAAPAAVSSPWVKDQKKPPPPPAKKGQGQDKPKPGPKPKGGGQGDQGVAGQKVTICHRTKSGTNPGVTITISISALKGHLAHGDSGGPCTAIEQKKGPMPAATGSSNNGQKAKAAGGVKGTGILFTG